MLWNVTSGAQRRDHAAMKADVKAICQATSLVEAEYAVRRLPADGEMRIHSS